MYLLWGWLLNQIITNFVLPFDSIIIVVISINAHFVKISINLAENSQSSQNFREFSRICPQSTRHLLWTYSELWTFKSETARLWLWRSKIHSRWWRSAARCRVNIAGQLLRGKSHLVEQSLHHFSHQSIIRRSRSPVQVLQIEWTDWKLNWSVRVSWTDGRILKWFDRPESPFYNFCW